MKSLLRPRARSKPVPTPAETGKSPLQYLRAFLLAAAILAATLVAATLSNLPARAAVVLEYFNAIPSSSAVLLEWSTASEYNVAGFAVFCKGVDEPRSAYHRLAFLNPKGDPNQGAQYDLLVTELKPGQAYCFRLEEVTTDDTPGEARERCGYGLGIGPTPAPSPTATLSQTVGLTPTVVLFPTQALGPDGLVPTATAPGAFITNTPDPFQFQSPLETPTPTWTPDPLLQGAVPTPFDIASMNATTEAAAAQQPTLDPLIFGTPTLDPLIYGTPTVDPFAQTPQQFDSPLETPSPAWTATAPLGQTPPADAAFPGPGEGAPAADAIAPTPTSLYVVVTAEPSPVAQGIAPGVTPWPTATPPSTFQLVGLFAPTAQNLTVMLLCFIFLSATGLGFLGLLTSIVYMRSRAQREIDDLRVRSRRRLL